MQVTKSKFDSIWVEFLIVIFSFVLAFGTVLKLETETRVSIQLGVLLAFLGFCFFVNITNMFNKLMLSTSSGLKFIKHFNLSLSDCMDISNKLVSAIQSVLSCVFGFFVCRYSCKRNFLTTSHIFSESYAWFGCAYFLYDIFSMYKVYNAKLFDNLKLKVFRWSAQNDFYSMIPTTKSGELSYFTPMTVNNQKILSFMEYIKITKLMVFHHMFIGSYGLIVISSWRGGLGDCIFSFMFLMECSTPFVSFRAILSILKMKTSKVYFVNGIVMLITFLIFRILMLPTLLYYYSTVVNLSFMRAIIKLPLGCQLSIIALFLPQFFWFHLMIKAALRMFKSPKEKIEINHNLKTE
ncbi:CLUMA_CG003439, isoform A [Clunio marinus]|uniref:CLUMA_CG003439, isoform A n=1 Tax=Clunio marinus TaxID=568069 RepID=A0A1J1HP75_9DIPT|nr:CLUMA_CG003439, isoform A [Clunio marinus]